MIRTLRQQQIDLNVDAEARAVLVKEGFSLTLGARPLQAVIRNRIRRPVARLMLEDKVTPGDLIQVDKEMIFNVLKAAAQV